MTHKCTKCCSLGPFYKDSRAKDGMTSQCKCCTDAKNAAYRLANYEKWLDGLRSYRAAHPEHCSYNESKKKWAAANKSKIAAKGARYRDATREKHRAKSSAWQKANPGRALAATRRYQAAKLKRTPAWADREAIAAVYVEAAQRGMHVDHHYPLQGKFVSGLHVHQNLRLLVPLDNMRKGNRFAPT